MSPPFFASLDRYCATILPLHFFLIPFQYRMHVIALVSFGHHWTFPSVSFLQLHSAVNLAHIVSLLMFSSLHCWAFVNWWPVTCSSNVCIWCSRFQLVSSFSSVRLYLAMILGSSHLSHLAFNGTMSGGASHPRAVTSISTHIILWLLGIPLPKASYPDWIARTRFVGMKMPSIGVPHGYGYWGISSHVV